MFKDKIKEYIECDRLEKASKKRKEELRKDENLEKFIGRCKGLGVNIFGVKYAKKESIKINEDEVFEYVQDLCREEVNGQMILNEEKFNKFCKRTIDLEKIDEVSKELKMKVLPLPKNCYQISHSVSITIDHNKLNG